MKSYKVNELFYSLQGEGMRAGTAALFLRLAGCNMDCSVAIHGFDCDTQWRNGRGMTAEEIVIELEQLASGCRWVVITGGEPALQIDPPLIERLHKAGYKLAIETNGTVELPAGLDWITVSPKVPEVQLRQRFAHEVKYVITTGQPIPQTTVQADHKLLSPAFKGMELDPTALAWCIDLVKQNPDWRLSLQMHKIWGVR